MNTTRFPTGAIVIRTTGIYPKDALCVDGYADDGTLLAHPLGGGFQLKFNPHQAARLREIPPTEREAPIYRRAKFGLEGSEKEFEGWTDGQLWNGWAMPTFEFGAAQEVAKSFNGRYDRERDCYITRLQDDDEEFWPAEEIVLVGGKKMKVYPIGSGAWIWDEV
jgi:hypothetical protein